MNAAKPIVIDDPSYDRPPDEAFWKWLPRSIYERKIGPYLVVGDSSAVAVPESTDDQRLCPLA